MMKRSKKPYNLKILLKNVGDKYLSGRVRPKSFFSLHKKAQPKIGLELHEKKNM